MLEYCLGNVDAPTRSRLEQLESPARERLCLQRCGTCWQQPFLVADGTVHTGPDHETLLCEVRGE